MFKTTMGAMSLTVCVTLLGVFANTSRAQNAAPAPLSKAIVGTWRGDAIYARQSTNFASVGLEIRFTDYGSVTVRREPIFPSRPGVDSWAGDYIVLGTSILISPHQQVPSNANCGFQLVGVTVENNRLEAMPVYAECQSRYLGEGIRLQR